MAGHDIIVVGTSTGGVQVLAEMVRGLPPGLPAALFVVCHFPSDGISRLPEILSRSGPLLAVHARDGAPIYPGQIYVAPPDYHLQLQPDHVQLTHGPRENLHRPAIDPLFRSAARAFGRRVIGVVLTGAHHDGVAGLLAVRAAGGIAVIQDPNDAFEPSLPARAQLIAGADHVVPAAGLAALLTTLVQQPVPPEGVSTMPDPLDQIQEAQVADAEAQARGERRGALSVFTCPECGGSLWQVDDEQLVRFRCHVGHVYNGETLLAEQAETLEAALWVAVRTFKDKAVLARQMAAEDRARGITDRAARFEEQAHLAERYADIIQSQMLDGPLLFPPDVAPEKDSSPAARSP